MNTSPLILYFDGLCPLCSREVSHYRKRATPGSVEFVDITDPEFNPLAHGLDPVRIHKVMHVKQGDQVRTGLDAFLAIWDTIPGHRWMARVARWPGVHALLTVGYHLFARIRPWLPRRKRDACTAGVCRR